MSKILTSGGDLASQIFAGIEELSQAVASTMGPLGLNVLIDKGNGKSAMTKDGVSVAKAIDFPDNIKNIGATLVKEASIKTASEAGDGTTTSTVLAYNMVRFGLDAINNSTTELNRHELRKGMLDACDFVVGKIKERSTQIGGDWDKILQIATISANGSPEIGGAIKSSIELAGEDGIITIEQGNGPNTEIKADSGLSFNKGYISQMFVNNESRLECAHQDARILITDEKIGDFSTILPILQQIGDEPLLIIASDVSGEALQLLVENHIKSALKCVCVKAPEFGDIQKAVLNDIAVATGATFLSSSTGTKVSTAKIEDLGSASKVIVNPEKTIIINGGGTDEAVEARKKTIKSQIKLTKEAYNLGVLKQRLAKLGGGVATIMVGGLSEQDMLEKKDRYDDALQATRAAMLEGYVVGGGNTLLFSAFDLEKEMDNNVELNAEKSESYMRGVNVVLKSLITPWNQIMENAFFSLTERQEVISFTNTEYFEGGNELYMSPLDKEYVNFVEKGVVDPAKVTRVALQNSVAVASMILTTNYLVSNAPQENEEAKS